MAKTLDFNSVKRPVLQLVMLDDDKTHINVSTPTEGLIEELQRTAPELAEVMRKGDADGIGEIYELAAKLINCNRSFIKVTAEDLRSKYRMDLEVLIIFFNAYLDFITEITDAKN
jgi:hypothetical protein